MKSNKLCNQILVLKVFNYMLSHSEECNSPCGYHFRFTASLPPL